MKKNLAATITIGGAITSGLKSALGSTRDGLNKIGKSITDLKQRQKELNGVITSQEKLGSAGSALRAQYANQELTVINKQIAALKERERIMLASAEGRAKAKGTIASGGLQIGAAIAAAAAFGAPIRAASDFEYQLRMIGNTANMTDAEISGLGSAIRAATSQTGQSAQTLTKSIGFLVAAGMDVGTAREMLGQIGRAATATGGDIEDLAKAAFVLNDTLKIAPGAEMAAALDTLAQAGKEGNVELKDMAKQLPVLGAGFASLKMSGREAAATMGAALEVARKGAADADEAANNMKNFIAKVMSPETLKKAKKGFGVDLYKIIKDAQTQGKNPFEASMRAIIQATQGDQKKIGELFGDMQVQNFLRPMIQNWDEYVRIKEKAIGASGVIDKDFESVGKTAQQQMAELGNAFGEVFLDIGTVALPALKSVVGTLRDGTRALSEFAQEHPGVTKGVLGVAGSLIGLTAALGAGKLAVGAIGYAWSAVPAIVTSAGAAITWMSTTALPAVAGGIRAIGMAAAANPIGLALAVIAGGAVLIWKNWEPIKGFFGGLWNGIKDAAAWAWDGLKQAWLDFTPLGLVVKNWEPIKGFFGSLFGDIKSAATAAIDWVLGKIQAVGELWGKTKEFLGFGGDSQPAKAPAGAPAGIPAAPALPILPAPRANGQVVTNNVTNAPNITINQQPGQDSKALADEVARRLQERQAVQQRGRMYDSAMGY